MKKINCVICNREIDKAKDDYYKVDLFMQGKKKGTDYAHKSCKEGQGSYDTDLKKLIKGVSSFAMGQGIIPEEKEVIIV